MIVLEVLDGYLCPGLVQQLTDERSGTAATQIGRISEIASPQFLVPEGIPLRLPSSCQGMLQGVCSYNRILLVG